MILADLESMDLTEISASLLKALIINSSDYARLGQEHRDFINSMDAVRQKHWPYVVGYGIPDHDRATSTDPYSALLIFNGELRPDTVTYFDIPVPADLTHATSGIKRLTITVVHAPEVQRWGLERYLATTLKWRVFRGDVDREEIIKSMSVEDADDQVENQPERPGELPGKLGIRLRSRGTIQHDVIEWTRHQEQYSANSYTLAISAYEKWARNNPDPVPFAVVVRLEDTTRTTQVYSAVQNILHRIQVRARASS